MISMMVTRCPTPSLWSIFNDMLYFVKVIFPVFDCIHIVCKSESTETYCKCFLKFRIVSQRAQFIQSRLPPRSLRSRAEYPDTSASAVVESTLVVWAISGLGRTGLELLSPCWATLIFIPGEEGKKGSKIICIYEGVHFIYNVSSRRTLPVSFLL